MPKSDTNEAVAIASALRPTVDEWGRESSRSCVRAKKMTVASKYDATTRTIGVREAFSATAQNIPCDPGIRGAAVGDPVWVEWLYGDKSTMHVVGPGDLSEFCVGGPNPNILDNWCWIGGGSQQGNNQFPINQRGQTTYTGGYTIDRWTSSSAITTSLLSDGLKLENTNSSDYKYFYSRFPFSKPYPFFTYVTGTILFSDGTLASGTVYPNQDTLDSSSHNWFFFSESWGGFYIETLPSEYNSYQVVIRIKASTTVQIAAVKVEIGKEQTLAYYDGTKWKLRELPNITTQLLRCQRYQVALNPLQFDNRWVAWAIATSGTKAVGIVTLPVPIDRTITAPAPTTWKLRYGSTNYSITAITPYRSGGATCHLDITSSGLTAGRMYIIANVNASDILLLDANL